MLKNASKSLVELASEGNLPEHQYMDAETLQWIKDNNPGFDKPEFSEKKGKYIINLVERLIPKKEWFLNDKIIDSIHGLRHVMRETSNMANLLYQKEYKEDYINSIYLASSLHDIRRQDDKGDFGHARRASDWFRENVDSVTSHFGIDARKVNVDEVSSAIELHEAPYDQITNKEEYLKVKEIADYVKTADALDRYRLPKLKWWINPEFLKLTPDSDSMAFAYWLVVESETEFLKSNNSTESVLKGLEKLIGK